MKMAKVIERIIVDPSSLSLPVSLYQRFSPPPYRLVVIANAVNVNLVGR